MHRWHGLSSPVARRQSIVLKQGLSKAQIDQTDADKVISAAPIAQRSSEQRFTGDQVGNGRRAENIRESAKMTYHMSNGLVDRQNTPASPFSSEGARDP